jgi:hypothetical protein
VLACHGWETIGERLSEMAAQRRWNEMGALITDEMLAAFAVEAPLDRLGDALRDRYHGLIDRICPYFPYTPGPLDDIWCDVADRIR